MRFDAALAQALSRTLTDTDFSSMSEEELQALIFDAPQEEKVASIDLESLSFEEKEELAKIAGAEMVKEANFGAALQKGIGMVASKAMNGNALMRAGVGAAAGAAAGAVTAPEGQGMGRAMMGGLAGGALGMGSRQIVGKLGTMNNGVGNYMRQGMGAHAATLQGAAGAKATRQVGAMNRAATSQGKLLPRMGQGTGGGSRAGAQGAQPGSIGEHWQTQGKGAKPPEKSVTVKVGSANVASRIRETLGE